MFDALNHQAKSIGIVGAGILGRLIAWQLQSLGLKVTLFDKDPIFGGTAASYTAAGMLAPYCELEHSEPLIYNLGQRSLELWPSIVESLQAENFFHQAGTLVIAHAQDQSDLNHFNQLLNQRLGSCGDLAFLNQHQLQQIEPELQHNFKEATYLKNESWIYTREFLDIIADQLLANGVVWHGLCEVMRVDKRKVITQKQTFNFDCVVDCRGMGAKLDVPQLRGVRGELLFIEAPDVNFKHMVRLMHPRYRLYLVPRDNHRYILGATQIENEDYSPISVRSALELLSALYSVHPGFSEARILETRTNCRPAVLDNLPFIQKADGIIRVNGLYRHGFLMAPALAEHVIADITQQAPPQIIGSLYRLNDQPLSHSRYRESV